MMKLTELHIRMITRASRNQVEDVSVSQDTSVRMLRVYVTVVPEAGKANAMLMKLLSAYFDLPKSAFELVRGETSRTKIVKVR